jgi:hypothetical protein
MADTTVEYYVLPISTTLQCTGERVVVTITVIEEPTFDLSSTTESICLGGSIDLATLVDNVNISDYHVVVYENGSSTPLSSTRVSPTVSSYYRVGVVSNTVSSCVSPLEEVYVTIEQQQYVSLTTPNQTICVGEDAIITADPVSTGTYLWTNSDNAVTNLVPTDAETATVTGLSAGTSTINYHYELASGCIGDGSVVITVNGLPQITSISNSVTECEGSTVLFSTLASVSAGSKLNVYTVETAGTALTSDRFVVSSNVIYYVEAEDLMTGCVSTPRQAIQVEMQARPEITLSATTDVICAGSSYDLSSLVTVTPAGDYTLRYTDAGGVEVSNPV